MKLFVIPVSTYFIDFFAWVLVKHSILFMLGFTDSTRLNTLSCNYKPTVCYFDTCFNHLEKHNRAVNTVLQIHLRVRL